MQTIVYQCDTAMPAQKLPNCCNALNRRKSANYYYLCKVNEEEH